MPPIGLVYYCDTEDHADALCTMASLLPTSLVSSVSVAQDEGVWTANITCTNGAIIPALDIMYDNTNTTKEK